LTVIAIYLHALLIHIIILWFTDTRSNIKSQKYVTSDVTTAIQQSITAISSATDTSNGTTTTIDLQENSSTIGTLMERATSTRDLQENNSPAGTLMDRAISTNDLQGNSSTIGTLMDRTTSTSDLQDYSSTIGTLMDRTTSTSDLQGNSSTTGTLMDSMASPSYICHCLMPPSKWCSRVHAHTKEKELKMILHDINELKIYLTVQKKYTSKYMRTKKSAPDARKSSQYIGVTAIIIVCVPVVLVSTSDILNFIVWFNRKEILR
jgi:hypothetical protein